MPYLTRWRKPLNKTVEKAIEKWHTRDGQTRIYDGPRWSGRCKYEQQDQKRDRQVPDEQTDTLWTLDNYNVGRQIQEHVEMARHMYTVD